MVKIGKFSVPKKTAIVGGSVAGGLLLIILLMFLFSGDEPQADPAPAGPAPVRPAEQAPVAGAKKKQGPSLLEVLPEGTLVSVRSNQIGALVQRGKDLGLWRWMKKTGLRSGLDTLIADQAHLAHKESLGALPERLSEVDPLTRGCLEFLESPRSRLERAGALFPGEVVLGIVGFNNKGNILPIPHVLMVADIAAEVDEAWLDGRLDRLLNYFNVQDSNSAFTVSRLRNNDDDLSLSYFRFGDKSAAISVGVWKKRLILSNDDIVFRKALRAVHEFGSKPKAEGEGAAPRRLVDTITWRQAALKLDPLADDLHVYIQNQMVGKLIASTLPVDSPLMKLDDLLGIQQCQAMAASLGLEGYAIRERLTWVYSGGLPEESLLSFLNNLPKGQKLSACAPAGSALVCNFHLDLEAFWNACLRFDNGGRVQGKPTDLDTFKEVLELGYNLYLDKLLKDFESEKLVYASRHEGQTVLGGLLAVKAGSQAHIKLLTAPAIHALETRWKGQIELERRPLGEHSAIVIRFANPPAIPDVPGADAALAKVATELRSMFAGFNEIHACLTPGHIALATTRAELEALVGRITLAKPSKPAMACPELQDASSRFAEPGQALVWFNTTRAISALQNRYGILVPVAPEEIPSLIPPSLFQVQILDPVKRRTGPSTLAQPTGIHMETFGPFPVMTPLFLSWALESRLGVIFGTGEPQKP